MGYHYKSNRAVSFLYERDSEYTGRISGSIDEIARLFLDSTLGSIITKCILIIFWSNILNTA